MKKNWYAIYTKGRWEKKVHEQLGRFGIESYCPLNIVLRKWSDRIKKVEEPLFKSYVFVRITRPEHTIVLAAPGVVNFVYWLGKPALVRDQEIDTVKRFLGEYDMVQAVPFDRKIEAGHRLRITEGIFMDKNATVLKVHNKTLEVEIESIGFRLIATLDKRKFESNQDYYF